MWGRRAMPDDHEFRIRYWGATGTFATPLAPHAVEDKLVRSLRWLLREGVLRDLPSDCDEQQLRELVERHVPYPLRSTYGGNTTCVEVQTRDALLILDAGSGLRRLGSELARRWNGADEPSDPGNRSAPAVRTAHVLITHAHMDHTYATPFVEPYYDPRNTFHILGPATAIANLKAVMGDKSPLRQVFFPVTFDMMPGIKSFRPVEAGQSWTIGRTRISTLALHHPGGCLAYRLDCGGRRFVFASDHEHTAVPDPALSEFAAGADLLYLDAQYVESEYQGLQGIEGQPAVPRRGWGHSTVEAVVETALAAEVRALHLGHHEPVRSDEGLAELEQFARRLTQQRLTQLGRSVTACEIHLAREGLAVDL
ncbi:MAG: MBL fold metallo-hydrolase [Pirellulaceae bacterium]|nr:MBL fold metallo-hydrolase [Pirellulaceae bacterium]